MTYFPPAPEDWQGWQPPPPDPRLGDPRSYQQPIPDGFGGDHSFVPQPDLAFAPNPSGQGEIPPWLLAMAQSVQQHPLGEGMHANNALQAFTLGLANRGGDVGSRRIVNQYADSTGNPGNKLALARLNMQRVTQTMAAQKESDANLNRAADNARADKYFGLAGRRQAFAENKPGKGFTMSDLQKLKLPVSYIGKSLNDLTPDQLKTIPATDIQDIAGQLDPRVAGWLGGLANSTGSLSGFPLGRNPIPTLNKIGLSAIEQNGGVPSDLGAAKATYKANSASLTNQQRNLDTVTTFSNTAEANLKPLEDVLPKVPDTGSPLLNQFMRPAASALYGDQNIRKFRTSLEIVRPEFQRILNAGATIGGGALHESDKKSLLDVLGDNFTKQNILDAIAILRLDKGNKMNQSQKQVDVIRGRISRNGAGADTSIVQWGRDPATGQPVRLQ